MVALKNKTNTKNKKPLLRKTIPTNDNGKRTVRKPKILDPDNMEVIDQMVYIFSKQGIGKKAKNRHTFASWLGFVMGGLIPLGSYGTAHYRLLNTDNLLTNKFTYILLGLLLYSSPTVYFWAKTAFGSNDFWGKAKPFGFVVGIESLMIFNDGKHLYMNVIAYTCLSVLVFINAVASGCKIALKRTVMID